MRILNRGLLPKDKAYLARCRVCETDMEYIGREAMQRSFLGFRYKRKLLNCPVCDNTMKVVFKNGYRPDAVPVEG